MITVKNLSFSYTGEYLYRNISFTIEDGRHCVLVGSNGTGKTTLIELITNSDTYIYDGKIICDENCRFGYVGQFVKHESDSDIKVFDYLCEDFRSMQREQDSLCAEMEKDDCDADIFNRYQLALDEFDAVDGYNYEVNIHKRLNIAGLTHIENVPVSKISGGEYKLVQIIRQMLRLPDLLVMDEPDTFLDFENLNSLNKLINSHDGTMLVVTHNRYILNHCFDKVLHLEDDGLREFDGNYIDYNFALLEMKLEQKKAHDKLTEWIEIQQELVEKLRKKATEVADPQRGQALKARVTYVRHLLEDRPDSPFLEVREPRIHLPEISYEETPEYALRVSDYSLAFDRKLLENVSFEIGPHDKVAIVGANGTGKTTMLHDIWEGKKAGIAKNPNVSIAFLSQLYGETLNENNSLMDELGFDRKIIAEGYLCNYCFPEGSASRKVKELSGGEKNLLQLAKLSLSGAGMLILDEPTSHLDIYAQLALENALSEYNGAVLMVSHDFYSIVNIADYILFVEGNTIRRMSGRAFRKMIYKNYYGHEYLELEQKKKELELKLTSLMRTGDFAAADKCCSELEEVIAKMK